MSPSLLSSAIYLIDLHHLNRNQSKHRHSILKWWQVQSAHYSRKYLCMKSERSGKNTLPKTTASTQPRTNLPFQVAPARSALLHLAAVRSCSPNLLPHPDHPQRLCSFIYRCSLRAEPQVQLKEFSPEVRSLYAERTPHQTFPSLPYVTHTMSGTPRIFSHAKEIQAQHVVSQTLITIKHTFKNPPKFEGLDELPSAGVTAGLHQTPYSGRAGRMWW